MGITVSFNNPASHGRPETASPATILAVLPDGACSLNVQEQGSLRYIACAAQGAGVGEWSFLPTR